MTGPKNRNLEEYSEGNRVRMEIVGPDSQPRDPWFVPKLETAQELKKLAERTGHTVYLFTISETGKLNAVQQ